MKKTIAEKWVKALRSKRYTQGRGALKVKTQNGVTKHCCLGVLCDLYQNEHERKIPVSKRTTKRGENVPANLTVFGFKSRDVFNPEEGSLPDNVRRWAGIGSEDGYFGHEVAIKQETTLIALNDNGMSFSKIADVIEEHFKAL
jgi:hypothetical protein